MTIKNENWCGGYQNWLTFTQFDKNCTVAKKPKSEKGQPVEWLIRQSTSKAITINELGNSQNMGFDLEKPVNVSILSDHWDDFCPTFVKATFYNYYTKQYQ